MFDQLCVVRGGGDLATGVAWRLTRAGMPLVVTELAEPLAVRRKVSLSTAIDEGQINVEGMVGRLAHDSDEAVEIASSGDVGVIVWPERPILAADVIVDARIAKRNIDTTIHDAKFVVGLGPGFEAGIDCHAVVETLRGPMLGRVIWTGSASPDTGRPDKVVGRDIERVLRAPCSGFVEWGVAIGDTVMKGDLLGLVGEDNVAAKFDGIVRGLIREGMKVDIGMKIGDVDPRMDTACDKISDKALAVGGGVLEAVLVWLNRNL